MEGIRRERYICIQEFMVRDLGLKGNELIVYALLYGFTQDGEQYFSGSLNYIANWINASKSTAQSVIKSLLGKGFLVKRDNYINNVKFCEYRTAIPEDAGRENPDTVPDSGMGHTENRYGGVPDSGTNNNIYNTNNNLEDNKYILSGTPDDARGSASCPDSVQKKKTRPKPKNHPEEIRQIIEYFNSICGTDYKYQSEATAKLINARLNDGFTVEDFRKVIDTKHAEWSDNPDMCRYLRPQTLFKPSHFENYLNQKNVQGTGSAGGISEECRRLYNSVVIE